MIDKRLEAAYELHSLQKLRDHVHEIINKCYDENLTLKQFLELTAKKRQEYEHIISSDVNTSITYIVSRLIKCNGEAYGEVEYLNHGGPLSYSEDYLHHAVRFKTVEEAQAAIEESKKAFGNYRPQFECVYRIHKLSISFETVL